MLAGAFALIFAAPDLGSQWLEAGWVLVFFVLAASAYAFFQVPYVAMPAEITTSYDERTRLMTWRVAILAFTIMLAGATAPVIRDAVGGRDGYRVMGVVMALVILVGVRERLVGHPARADRRGRAGAGSLREQLRVVGPGPRLPGAADHVRPAGAGDRLHARRASPTSPRTCSAARARPRSSSSASSVRRCC